MAWTVCWFKGGLARKRGWCFWWRGERWYHNTHYESNGCLEEKCPIKNINLIGEHYHQAFINYKFSCTRFCTCLLGTSVHMGNCAHKRADMHFTNNMIPWYSSRNCTKLVLKPLACKNSLSISGLYIATFLQIIQLQFTWWLPRGSLANLIYWPLTMNLF